jgi:hypothetical protein
MDKESLPPGDVESSDEGAQKNGVGPAGKSGDKFPNVTPGAASDKLLAERRQGNRRTGERRVEERRSDSRREDADRRETERRFLTMEALEAAAQSDAEIDSPMRREGGLWPSLDWRPGEQRIAQRRASERRIDDRRQQERRKTDRRSRGRRVSDREDLYHGQVQLDENIDDLFEAGDYKGSAD